MGKRLPYLRMHNQHRRDFVVEEGAWNSTHAMGNMNTLGSVCLPAVFKVTLEMCCTKLVGIDLKRQVNSSKMHCGGSLTIFPSRGRNWVDTTFKKYWNIYWALVVYDQLSELMLLLVIMLAPDSHSTSHHPRGCH